MRSLFFSCILFISLSVKGYSQTIAADTTDKNYIEFGNGGGFTGAVSSYLLTEDGKLYRIETANMVNRNASFIKRIKKCKTNRIYRYAIKNNIAAFVYNEPGNAYAFISIQLNKQSNKIIWNNSNIMTPEPILKLYAKLIKLR